MYSDFAPAAVTIEEMGFLSLFIAVISLAADDFRICYFSLNNEKEFTEMQAFSKKLNKISPRKIQVKEYLSEGGDVEESFRKMVNSGDRCDGLVISGHHSGSFGGKRTDGTLELELLENLSCDPKTKKWFQGVNALWLQGCRTLGVGKIQSDNADTDMFSADFHTNRVGREREQDNLEQSFQALNAEFSATLDQDNPLSSRYLRLFPQAKVFGWTRTAPGEKARSELSIPYHMAHIASLMAEKEEFPNAPDSNWSAKDTVKYVNAIMLTLGNIPSGYRGCEDLVVDAWKSHGQAFGKKPFSFDNPDLNAFPRLYSSMDDFLLEVRDHECELKKAKTKKDAVAAIRELLKNPQSIRYGFNSIWQKIRSNEVSEEVKSAIRAELGKSSEFQNFLQGKLQSNQLGILSKIDYYSFYRDLTKKKNEKIEDLIFQASKKILTKPKSSENDYDLIDYQRTLLESLEKNGFLNSQRVLWLAENTNVDSSILNDLSISVGDLRDPPLMKSKALQAILRSKNHDEYTAARVVDALSKSDPILPDSGDILLKAAKLLPFKEDDLSPEWDFLVQMNNLTGRKNAQIPDYGKTVDFILSKNPRPEIVESLAEGLFHYKGKLNGEKALLFKKVLMARNAGPTSTAYAVRGLLRDPKISKSEKQRIEKSIFQESVYTDDTKALVFAELVRDTAFDNWDEKFKMILNSKKVSDEAIAEVIESIGSTDRTIDFRNDKIFQLVQHPNAAAKTYENVFSFYESMSPGYRQKTLDRIVSSNKFNGAVAGEMISSLATTKLALERKESYLKNALKKVQTDSEGIVEFPSLIKSLTGKDVTLSNDTRKDLLIGISKNEYFVPSVVSVLVDELKRGEGNARIPASDKVDILVSIIQSENLDRISFEEIQDFEENQNLDSRSKAKLRSAIRDFMRKGIDLPERDELTGE